MLQPVESLLSPWGAWLLLLLAACSLLAWRGWRNALGLALLLYIVSVAPTSNLLFATGVSFAELLSYLPSAWFCLGLAALAASCQRRIPDRVVVGAGLCFMITIGGVTAWRNRDYRDPQQLWRADVRTDPQNPLVWLGLAVAQENEGDYRRAEESCRRVLRVAPGFADGHNGYASLLYRQGRFSEALEQAGLSAANGQGAFVSACVLLARSALQLELWPQALQALKRLPGFIGRRYAVFWELRGRALQGEGVLEEALAAFRKEAELEPEREPDVGSRIAALLLRLDREGEAPMREHAP